MARPRKEIVEEVAVEKPKTTRTKKPKESNEFDEKRKERDRLAEIRKRISTENPRVTVVNNFCGKLQYIHPTTQEVFEFSEFGDIDEMDYEILKTMKNRNLGMLKKYWIVPIDVIDSDIELKDLLECLKISEYYNEDMLFEDSIDTILNYDLDELERFIKKCDNGYVNTLLERALDMYHKGIINGLEGDEIVDTLNERLGFEREETTDIIDTLDILKNKSTRR